MKQYLQCFLIMSIIMICVASLGSLVCAKYLYDDAIKTYELARSQNDRR